MEDHIISNEQLQSKVISFLRLPLCVAVVLIHVLANTSNCVTHPIYDSVHYLLSEIFSRVAVPLFFMFSGFLFFYKVDKFTLSSYKNKLTKRIHTLLIPYIFWNLIIIIGRSFSTDLSFTDWIRPFWSDSYPSTLNDEGIASYPITIQFWYIRDLMVTVILTPIIYLLTKKLHIYFITTLAVLWITNCWFLVTGLNITAIFFFSLGSYCSIYNINFAELLKPYTLLLGIIYLLIIIPIFIIKDYNFNPLRRIGILAGMAFTISLVARYVSNGKWKINKSLSESSFFIFAYHILALRVIKSIVDPAFKTDIMCTMQYLILSGLVTIAGLILYSLLKKSMPKFTSLITGGR